MLHVLKLLFNLGKWRLLRLGIMQSLVCWLVQWSKVLPHVDVGDRVLMRCQKMRCLFTISHSKKVSLCKEATIWDRLITWLVNRLLLQCVWSWLMLTRIRQPNCVVLLTSNLTSACLNKISVVTCHNGLDLVVSIILMKFVLRDGSRIVVRSW